MKLRRVLTAVAATAVIAPVALLSAPAAFAEESSSTSPTATASDTTSATPTDTVSATPSDTTVPTNTSSDTASSTPTGTPTSAGASATGSASSTPSASAEPSEEPDYPYCDEVDEDFDDVKVTADIKGLPGKIVAGDGFHSFQLVVTNDSSAGLRDVTFYAEVENYEFEDESKFLSPYIDLEFKNPDSGSWERIGDDYLAGDDFYSLDTLAAKAGQTIDLRLGIDADAPTGDAYSFGSGAYLDNVDGQECLAEGWAAYDFEVLKAGSENTDPGSATHSDTKGGGKSAQGGYAADSTGNLADTGSNSALPVIGLMSGVAVMAGAGVVVAARRRRAGA